MSRPSTPTSAGHTTGRRPGSIISMIKDSEILAIFANGTDSRGKSNVNTPPEYDKRSHSKRKTWCTTSSFLPDIHAVFHHLPNHQPNRPIRPASVIGILHSGSRSSQEAVLPRLYQNSSVVVSDSNRKLSASRDQMTPSKEKRPLPKPEPAIVQPDHPSSLRQWRSVLEGVRLLLLNREWQQCIDRCRRLLDNDDAHPLHKCYLQFYEALSQELLARSMHELSVNKLPLLHSARESYLVALHSLLEASNVLRHDFTDEQSLPSSPVVSDSTSPPYTPTPAPRRSRFTATITRSPILAASPSSWSFPQKWVSPSQAALAHDPVFGSPLRRPAPLEISRIWLSSSQASLANDPAFGSPVRRPSPLRVLKSVLKTGPFAADGSQTPPLTPPPKRNLQISTPAAITFSASTTSWLHDRALQRYNAHSNDFDQMLHRHVEVVDTLIKSTLEVEAERYQKRPSKSSNGDEGRRLEKRARIEKLKAKEWRRERFRPERYQELCAKALAEL